jgi:hypothetical protein
VNLARLRAVAPETEVDSGWRRRLAAYGEEWAWRLDGAGEVRGRFNQAQFAWTLDPTPRRFMFMAKSWLKMMLKRSRRNAGFSSVDGAWRIDDHSHIVAATQASNDNVLKGTER